MGEVQAIDNATVAGMPGSGPESEKFKLYKNLNPITNWWYLHKRAGAFLVQMPSFSGMAVYT
jgi:hypothetical protein